MRAFTFALALALLAGCAPVPMHTDPAQRVDEMLATVLQARRSSVSVQRRSLAQAQRAFSLHHGGLDRLRLATLLATLPEPLGDDARASELLAPLTAHRPATPVTRLASLLAEQLAQRRELRRVVLQREQALRQSDEQAQALQHKLQELQAIDRKALNRDMQLQ